MKKRGAARIALFAVFILYLVFLLYLLFFASALRAPSAGGGLFSETHLYYCNLVPFKTVREYEKLLKEGRLIGLSLINLLGNLFAFAPQGFFIPMLFPGKYSRFSRFFILELIFITGVEILQFLTFRGSLDIDDLILNLAGACLFFLVTKCILRLTSKKEPINETS